jgi:hypothetical protein
MWHPFGVTPHRSHAAVDPFFADLFEVRVQLSALIYNLLCSPVV